MSKNNKLKVLSIVGTRPELIRLSRILAKMDKYFNHILVFTRQNYSRQLSTVFLNELEYRKPDLTFTVQSKTLGGQIAKILEQSEKVMLSEKPDALVVLGDTNSALSAIIARRMHIPIFHLEAGNRSFDWNVPEEVNRRIIDHISNYNLAYTEHARSYLMSEGIARQSIFVTGSPLSEVIDYYSEKISSSNILKKLAVNKKEYFIASIHREENVDDQKKLKDLMRGFSLVSKKYKKPIIITLHPRTKKCIKGFRIRVEKMIQFHEPFGYFDYCHLQKNALCTLSDSGTIQEESQILSFPAVQVRVSTERPEAFDTGSIILSGLNPESICQSVQMAIAEYSNNPAPISQYYTDLNISEKVVKLILGLTSTIINEKEK